MRKAIEMFVRFPIYANLAIFFIIVVGGISMYSMKKSFFPETESRFLSVSVAYPGASPVEMEEGVTSRIEEAVRGIPGIYEITSVFLYLDTNWIIIYIYSTNIFYIIYINHSSICF